MIFVTQFILVYIFGIHTPPGSCLDRGRLTDITVQFNMKKMWRMGAWATDYISLYIYSMPLSEMWIYLIAGIYSAIII